jgi:hypothetical protein
MKCVRDLLVKLVTELGFELKEKYGLFKLGNILVDRSSS